MDVEDTLRYAKEKLVDKYDVNNNGLSAEEIEQMSLTARLAVRFAKTFKESGIEEGVKSAKQILEGLKALGEGLYFPAWANESDAYLQLFHREADLQALTPENFASTMGLNPQDPAEEVYIFQQGLEELWWIFENYEDYDEETYPGDFETLLDFMVTHLTHITHIIVGSDGARDTSEYPVYLVGLTPDGHIAGFETHTIWT